MSDILIYAFFGVILAIIFALIYLQNAQFSRKFGAYAQAIDKLAKENFTLKKRVEELGAAFKLMTSSNLNASNLNMEKLSPIIDAKVSEALKNGVAPIIESLEKMEFKQGEFQSEQRDRMYSLEEKAQTIGKITPPNFASEEDKIEEMYRKGYAPEDIARDLRVSVGRVHMVLNYRKVL